MLHTWTPPRHYPGVRNPHLLAVLEAMPTPRPNVRVYAPGSIGNVGPGLDILGLAVTGAGDRVEAIRTDAPGIRVLDPGAPLLPTDPKRNSAAIAAHAMLRHLGVAKTVGLELRIRKGLPLSAGQGGSAASAVAGAAAALFVMGEPFEATAIISCAMDAEVVVSGRHADNIVPTVLGGLTLIRTLDPLDVIRIPTPPNLYIVLAHPDQQFRTRDGRAVLPETISRAVALHQAAQVAALVAGAMLGDLRLLGRAIDDRIAEPARAALLQGFREAKAAALASGALGCSISGSGPTAFAIVDDPTVGTRVSDAMGAAYVAAGRQCSCRIAQVEDLGVREIDDEPWGSGHS